MTITATGHPIPGVWFEGGVFGGGRSNGAISGWIKSKMAAGGHFEKSNDHNSKTNYQIQFMYVPRPYYMPSDSIIAVDT